jgi:hypothetical protein
VNQLDAAGAPADDPDPALTVGDAANKYCQYIFLYCRQRAVKQPVVVAAMSQTRQNMAAIRLETQDFLVC